MAVPKLSDVDKRFLLSIKPEDIDYKLIVNLFGSRFIDGKIHPPRFLPYQTCMLKSGEYFNKADIDTTAGSIIVNKFLIEYCGFQNTVGYVNEVLRESTLRGIERNLAGFVRQGLVDLRMFEKFLERVEWLGMRCHSVFCGSFTPGTIKPNEKVMKRKAELLEIHKDAIQAGDPIVIAKIEKELLDLAKEELKGDPGMALYDSEARGSFSNNYKNIAVMRGAIKNPSTGEYDVVESNFVDGIAKKDIPASGNTVPTGSYPKAVGTGVSGYFSKQLYAALQSVVVDPDNLFCGTKATIPTIIPKKGYNDFLYKYINEGGKRVFLDDNTIKKYIGKTVHLYTVLGCTSKQLCLTCAGTMFKQLGINNVGLTAARVSGTTLNLSMKAFHDSSIKIYNLKINDLTI